MRKEDLKDWTRDRLKDEIVNLSEKNFNLEWRIKQFEESEGRWKCEIENIRTENKKLEDENARLEMNIKSQREKINSLMKELEEEKGKTITISDGMITMRADMWEALNENKKLEAENESLKKDCKSLSDRALKAERENSKMENMLKTSTELINVLEEKLSKYEGIEITISGYETGRECECCGQCNDKLKDENKALKQKIQYIETMLEASYKPESAESVMRKTGFFTEKQIRDIYDYEPQLAPDDDILAFNYDCIKLWGEELDYKKKISELQDQHQQDCIKINQLHVTIDVLTDKYSRLRKTEGD